MNVPESVVDLVNKDVEAPKPFPGIPIEAKTESKSNNEHANLFIMHYRYGNVPHLSKVFKFNGNLREAILRGRQHCLAMNYTFIWLRPFITDLDEQERRRREPDYEESVIR